jgi:hypothetical protein
VEGEVMRSAMKCSIVLVVDSIKASITQPRQCPLGEAGRGEGKGILTDSLGEVVMAWRID